MPTNTYRHEVVPYPQASWAPPTHGIKFSWAWRILNDKGETRLSGVANGGRADVEAIARRAKERVIAFGTSHTLKTTWQRSNGQKKTPATSGRGTGQSKNDAADESAGDV